MASVVSRTSDRRTWAPVSKAQTPAATRDLSVAGIPTVNSGLTGFGVHAVPPETEQALADQGMQTAAPFAPGRPINPFAPFDMPARGWDFPVGYNIASRPRAGTGRIAFETMKSILDSWDVARLCIEHIEDDIRSMEWTIAPKQGVEDDVTDQIAKARKFWEKPDGTPFDGWQQRFLEDVLRFDAGCLYRNRMRGGQLGSLEVVSGITVAPLIDYYGRTPQDDAPAYIQYANGVPWLWLRQDALIYEPFRKLPESVYGLPAIEWLLLTANTDLRFQWHFLLYFTEGSVPDMFLEAPPDMSDPEQIKRFQAAWDATMEGDQSQKHKVRWVPSGSKPFVPGNKNFDEKFPLYLMRKTCAAYHVTPHDIGFVEDVNRSSGETQMDVQFRIGTLPRAQYLQGIYTRVTNEELGLPDVEFQFDTGREKEDRLDEARVWDFYVRMGAASPDEPRAQVLGLPVDNANPVPRFVVDRTGIVPLSQIHVDSGDIDPATMAPKAERVRQLHADGDIVARTVEAPPPPALPAGSPATTPTSPAADGSTPPASQQDPQPIPASKGPQAIDQAPVAKQVAIVAAGLLVKSQHSGRVLMIQRGHHDTGTPSDPSRDIAAGKWEFPGGRLEPGEEPLAAAKREWQEEVGCPVPPGQVAAMWTAPSGIYQGFVWLVEHEHDVPINLDPDRRGIYNPDDPDGDKTEVVAWWDPRDLPNLPSLRDECFYADWSAILAAGQASSASQAPNHQTPGSVAKGQRWAKRERARQRREVAAAGLPFVKAAEPPLHDQTLAAEQHHADRLTAALGRGIDPHAVAAGWLERQPVRKAAPPVAMDLRQAALAFLRGLRPSLSGLAELLRAIYRDGWQLGLGGALQAAAAAGYEVPASGIDWSAWRPGSEQVAQAAQGLASLLERADVVIQGVSDTALERLAAVLADGARAGDSVDAIARGLRGILDDPDHAYTVAQTELARAQSAASLATYGENGITGKGWLVYNPCPICARNVGVVLPLDGVFPSGDQMPPAHPRCRCSLTPERLSP